MRLPRRQFLHLAAGAAALPVSVRAQAYPSRPVKIIVGQAAGSASDIVARLIAQFLSERLGQQFLVEVRPGATGNIATEAVSHMPPDGYALLLVNSQNAINTALYEKLNFDFVRDIAPVGMVESVPLVMEIHPSLPARTIPEFIAYAKANPGKLNMASAGIGGPQHIAGELFKFMAGVDLTHVPYKGSTPAVIDLVAGQVQVMFDVTPTALPQIRAGTLRPLGVSTTERLAFLPDVPTIDSFLPGYEASGWIGFGAPRGTPAEVIATLNRGTNAAVLDPNIRQRFADIGAVAVPPSSPEEFGKLIAENIDKWTKVIKLAGIKPQ
ncbi:MAG TPA: tripartite tricarboxylate transporter substrate binding protein [Xanthobacteraceae bacterium]|jgi:tripartite-type tricarboxylate transporter receptor subunit TctC